MGSGWEMLKNPLHQPLNLSPFTFLALSDLEFSVSFWCIGVCHWFSMHIDFFANLESSTLCSSLLFTWENQSTWKKKYRN